MSARSAEQNIYYTLRLAVAMCFIGHGAFGVITKPIWCNFFAILGIGQDLAYQLMPPVGILDILMGIIILIYPIRAIFGWLVFWGLLTALLRPLSGESFAEFFERAGNYGAPFVLLLLTGLRINSTREWFAPARLGDSSNSAATMKQVTLCLRIIVFLLLAGHGWLNLIGKKGLIDQYTSLGFYNPGSVAQGVGIFELLAAFTVLIRPFGPFLLVLFAWKMVSEMFYLNYPVVEWIERGGSYGAILALWFAVRSQSTVSIFKWSNKRNRPLTYAG